MHAASNMQTEKMMDSLEADFSRIVKENRSTIYTVCYMFSKNEDEVAAFSRIFLSICGGVFLNSGVRAVPGHGYGGSA